MLIQSGGLLDPTALLEGSGPWVLPVIMGIIFIETGLLFPFLPGDSLIFTAALLAGSLGLPLPLLIAGVAVAAIVGDSVAYAIGRRFGRRLFTPDARILKTRYLDRADAFFAKYGAHSLVLARFVPVVRTFVPPVVGMSSMPYRRFLLWNAIGGIAWALLLAVAGFFLGKIPVVADNVDLIAVGIVVISVIPIAIAVFRERRADKRERDEGRGQDASTGADRG
ncbi:membrane-associated protein [Microbacterium endophyticum]|uniref:Membrane-associated protein n=1 Tax=Microbacterium endophyticum TaxID=1526412 RepID=A0A7W4V1R1_9MICO|nr:VTT domain-containing protein [Microbacterium endophyticum]MBB2975225.1 membrane-associated protein [Microbacterium endophyticum]NIK37563.1 membrane-associated protein [Microbacterium endophyticum]